MASELKKEFLDLLDKDAEFRYAIAGYLGLGEIIKKLDEHGEILKQLVESNNKLWEEVKFLREGQDKLWQENQRIWEELKSLREGQDKLWQENQRIWEELKSLREDMQKGFQRHEERFERVEMKLTALGSRWGVDSEATFRNAMRGLLEQDFHVKVQNLILLDDEGFVFGAKGVPIEYDVVITDGGATLIELKSSVGRDDVYVFLRKVEFFKKRMGMEVKRGVIASPFFERDSAEVARRLGLEVYTGSKPSEGEGTAGNRE